VGYTVERIALDANIEAISARARAAWAHDYTTGMGALRVTW
jgi:hypothetical protein